MDHSPPFGGDPLEATTMFMDGAKTNPSSSTIKEKGVYIYKELGEKQYKNNFGSIKEK